MFKRVWDKFQKVGVTKQSARKKKGKITDNQQIMGNVVRQFNVDPNVSIRIAANDLGMSPTITWRVAKAAKLEPFKPFSTHLISPQNTQKPEAQFRAFDNLQRRKVLGY